MSETNGRPPIRDMSKRIREDEGLPPAGFIAPHGGTARTTFFGHLHVPMQNGTGDPSKAYPKGMPPAVAAKAAEIVADKKRRDAEAVANGTARPGQIAGARRR